MRARHGAPMKRPRIHSLLVCALLVLNLAPATSFAQGSRVGNELPPYEQGLLRLVTILGSLEFLHPLCDLQNKGVWKAQMANLLEAEEPSPARRARMMATYNKSYEVLEQVHRTCTQTVRLILTRYETEAVELTRTLATTYRPVAQTADEPAGAQTPTEGDAATTVTE